MTHSLKVAQVARTLAVSLGVELKERWIAKDVHLDPQVAYAAALAHDLGHPPFGHIGESELNQWAEKQGLDGFEGNAQSFRILTRLEPRSRMAPGMDLTGATLNAVLKYPWLRTPRDEQESGESFDPRAEYRKRRGKWGAYHSDSEVMAWARASAFGLPDGRQVLEAAVMDVADDFTYALHDLDDFAQVRLIDPDVVSRDARRTLRNDRTGFAEGKPGMTSGLNPITRIGVSLAEDYPERFDAEAWFSALEFFNLPDRWIQSNDFEELVDEEAPPLPTTASSIPWEVPPQNETRVRLREWTSTQLTEFSKSLNVVDVGGWPDIDMDSVEWHYMQTLKQITRRYVISRTDLSAVQFSQRRVLSELCELLTQWAEKDYQRLPERLVILIGNAYAYAQPADVVEHFVEPVSRGATNGIKRGVVDFVAELTDSQAIDLHAVLSGRSSSSMVEGILNIF